MKPNDHGPHDEEWVVIMITVALFAFVYLAYTGFQDYFN